MSSRRLVKNGQARPDAHIIEIFSEGMLHLPQDARSSSLVPNISELPSSEKGLRSDLLHVPRLTCIVLHVIVSQFGSVLQPKPAYRGDGGARACKITCIQCCTWCLHSAVHLSGARSRT